MIDHLNLFFFFGGHMSFFVGPLIPLFWIYVDVCPRFQSKGGSCLHAFLPALYTSDSPLDATPTNLLTA